MARTCDGAGKTGGPRWEGVMILGTTILCVYAIILGDPHQSALTIAGALAAGTTACVSATRRSRRVERGARLVVAIATLLAAGILLGALAPTASGKQPVAALLMALAAVVCGFASLTLAAAFIHRTRKEADKT